MNNSIADVRLARINWSVVDLAGFRVGPGVSWTWALGGRFVMRGVNLQYTTSPERKGARLARVQIVMPDADRARFKRQAVN